MTVRRTATTVAVAAALAVLPLALGACTGNGQASRHGQVVGHLRIPFKTTANAPVVKRVIRVAVAVGERFSVKVDTSDGPFFWNQVGPPPDRHLIKLAGNFDQGSCAPNLAGCRVPYFHTLVARAKGSTTMTWRYHNLACTTSASARAACTRVATVTFSITIR